MAKVQVGVERTQTSFQSIALDGLLVCFLRKAFIFETVDSSGKLVFYLIIALHHFGVAACEHFHHSLTIIQSPSFAQYHSLNIIGSIIQYLYSIFSYTELPSDRPAMLFTKSHLLIDSCRIASCVNIHCIERNERLL